jgi:TetR/AcrR family transcriptional regulator, fatty acid metabolism regulator protein
MPAISVKRMQDRSAAILEAAQRIFVARGYQAAAIAEIARAAGISDGLIYRYYESKRQLLDAVLAAFFERILNVLEPALAAERGFSAKLRALIRTHLQILMAEPGLCRLFIAEVRGAAEFSDSEAQAMNRRYSKVFLDLIRDAQRARELRDGVEPALLRDLVFGGVEHLAWRAMSARAKARIAADADLLADLVLRGVAR